MPATKITWGQPVNPAPTPGPTVSGRLASWRGLLGTRPRMEATGPAPTGPATP